MATVAAQMSMTPKPAAMRWLNQLIAKGQNGVWAGEMTITPDIAAAILSRNPDNRNIRESKAAQYESDMREGRFPVGKDESNGESIIISKDGLLNDGQHRLWACLRSGKSFTTVVVCGVKRDSRYTIDIGAAKSAGDHLSFLKVQNAATNAAIARFVLVWEKDGTLNKRSQVSASEQIARVQSDALLRDISKWVDNSRYRMKNYIKGSIVGFLFYTFAKNDPKLAKQFFEALRDGTNLSAGTPVYMLREKLLLERDLTHTQKVEYTIRAWNYWVAGAENIARLSLHGRMPDIATASKPVISEQIDAEAASQSEAIAAAPVEAPVEAPSVEVIEQTAEETKIEVTIPKAKQKTRPVGEAPAKKAKARKTDAPQSEEATI